MAQKRRHLTQRRESRVANRKSRRFARCDFRHDWHRKSQTTHTQKTQHTRADTSVYVLFVYSHAICNVLSSVGSQFRAHTHKHVSVRANDATGEKPHTQTHAQITRPLVLYSNYGFIHFTPKQPDRKHLSSSSRQCIKCTTLSNVSCRRFCIALLATSFISMNARQSTLARKIPKELTGSIQECTHKSKFQTLPALCTSVPNKF